MVSMLRKPPKPEPEMTAPDYPYGLCLSLDHDTLKKLSLEADCDVGDQIVLRMVCRVTACSQREVDGAAECRIELQGIDVKVLGEIPDGDEDD